MEDDMTETERALKLRISTEFVFPPIPDRRFDWSAVDADTYDEGSPIGWGRTEAEAIRDLISQLFAG
jgi:hypothetical protein